jgi:hypothetical protein
MAAYTDKKANGRATTMRAVKAMELRAAGNGWQEVARRGWLPQRGVGRQPPEARTGAAPRRGGAGNACRSACAPLNDDGCGN